MRTSGWVAFAAVMMIVAGLFGAIDGLVAIVNDEVYLVGEDQIVALDFTQWGWIHLIVGSVVMAAGFAVMTGQMWARFVGVFVATMHAVSQIWFITAYPLWTILIIAIDILIIYALIVHGEEVEQST
jgi:hypothetical protein